MDKYIKQDYLLAALSIFNDRGHGDKNFLLGIESAKEIVRNAPSSDMPVIYSQWEECDYVEPDGHRFGTIRIPNAGLKCRRCNHVFKKELLWANNYCPNCGAKMSGEDNAID